MSQSNKRVLESPDGITATDPKKQHSSLDDTLEYKSMDPELLSYIQDAIKESLQSLLQDLF